MLNRGFRRLTVGEFCKIKEHLETLTGLQVSLDEIRSHNRELADGYVGHRIASCSATKKAYRLLKSPFDFSQAFDQALKNIVVALPNRPAIESSDDAVSQFRFPLLRER